MKVNIAMIKQNRNIFYIALGTILILLIPLTAMQLTNEVKWGLFDFIIAGLLLFTTGLIYELTSRRVKGTRYRVVIAFILITILLLIWAELAVGIFR